MSLEETKRNTAALLGVDISRVAYITDKSLAEAARTARVEILEKSNADGVEAFDNWGVYCHNIQYPAGKDYIEYQRGPKGTPNYGCGNDWYQAKKTLATHIKPLGSKCGNDTQYLVSNYPA